MLLSEYDLDKREGRRVPGPRRCIYCGDAAPPLTEEHVIPFALAANTLVLENSCCVACQRAIQPYEQEVLGKQLRTFRAQVDAPTRRKRDRPTEVSLHFVEVNGSGAFMRDLGARTYPIEEVPLTLSLWTLPPPRFLLEDSSKHHEGHPWCYTDKKAAMELCRAVAKETGSTHVAIKVGEVNRGHFLRFIAKTAHAYAVTELGVGSFRPYLTDLILNQSDDLTVYVGGGAPDAPFPDDPSQTVQIALGGIPQRAESRETLVARIQFYPTLGSPAYLVAVGEREARRDA